MFIGAGTALNVVTIVVGVTIGVTAGHRLNEAARTLISQTLGLVTVVIAGFTIAEAFSEAFTAAVGSTGRMLIVLISLLLGGLLGVAVRLEERLDQIPQRLGQNGTRDYGRFMEGAITATLLFCVGPLSILGSISDGLGRGIDQLALKAVMDGVAAIAFGATFGLGVMAAVIPLTLYQGSLTLAGFALGNFLSPAQIDSLAAAGGVILLGLGLKIAGVHSLRIVNLIPALVVAPLLTTWVATWG